jgi:hypothetical protein
MLLLRLLSTALCAAVAALVFALVHPMGAAALRPAGRVVRVVRVPAPRLAALSAAPPARVCPFPSSVLRIRALAGSTAARDAAVLRATAARADRSPGGVPINVIDVAPGVPAAQIAGLIQLGPGEHVAAVNDRVAASDLEVGALIASLPRRGDFLDLTVASPTRERRVLVLLH